MKLQLEQLERDGYTVFPGFLDTGTTTRIRAHMDSLLPEPSTEPDANRLHLLRHPIPGEIMAEILNRPELLTLASELLGSNDLRLLEQVLIRTDGPAPIQKIGASGWHIDSPFLPEHYHARPRQTYFHMVHALNNVPPSGGAFTVIPGSHHKTFAAAAKLGSEEELKHLETNVVEMAGINLDEAIEVLPEDGDLLVFNPMAVHSASHNQTTTSRYVYFASFYDPSATYLANRLTSRKYRDNFPDSLRQNLPSGLQSLLAP